MKFHAHILAIFLFSLLCVDRTTLNAQPTPKPLPDAWLPDGVHPDFITTNHWTTSQSGTLTNEALVGRLKVYWHAPTGTEVKSARLWSSADAPGRWRARDWQSLPMEKRGERWETALPIENVDIPVIYFVETETTQKHTTALRLCRPRLVGLEEPSRIFWPFLEGFEEELWSWRTVTDEPRFTPVETGTIVKNGNAALRLVIPAGKRSITVTTTRIRGWQLEQNFARGIRLWVRLGSGTAKLRCTLQAHAFTPQQTISLYPDEPEIGTQWQPVDLTLNRFPKLSVGEVDLMSLELIGNGPLECFVDDVQLLGRWHTVD
ncbi:MAG: hypothetical protein K0Q55_319 [Verrucomicrobia bacterium]|jgi:hypothetical protein|nr:hypothetical protein [Verrucomicrobiota bacterium]